MPITSFVLQIGTLVQPMFNSKVMPLKCWKWTGRKPRNLFQMKHKRGFELKKKGGAESKDLNFSAIIVNMVGVNYKWLDSFSLFFRNQRR